MALPAECPTRRRARYPRPPSTPPSGWPAPRACRVRIPKGPQRPAREPKPGRSKATTVDRSSRACDGLCQLKVLSANPWSTTRVGSPDPAMVACTWRLPTGTKTLSASARPWGEVVQGRGGTGTRNGPRSSISTVTARANATRRSRLIRDPHPVAAPRSTPLVQRTDRPAFGRHAQGLSLHKCNPYGRRGCCHCKGRHLATARALCTPPATAILPASSCRRSHLSLTNRCALVTGAGVGSARTALEFARRGADVVLSYHSSGEGAQSAVDEIRAMGRRATAPVPT